MTGLLAILMCVDPHLLRTFTAVARCGSFSQAAVELGYTQSAVSQHIAALEHDLGTTLLRRRPVAPTEAGARLLEHAGPLLLRLDAARADITRLTTKPTARVVIGASPLAMAAGVAEAVATLHQTQPRLDMTVRILGPQTICSELAAGTLDVGLVNGMAAPTDPLHLPDLWPLTTNGITEDPLAVALPDDHPLARRISLRLADLADARWIDAPDAAVPLDQLRVLDGQGAYRTSMHYDGTDTQALLSLTAAGNGLALLPQSALTAHPGIAAVPISEPRLVHRVELLHSPTLTGPARLLAAALANTPDA